MLYLTLDYLPTFLWQIWETSDGKKYEIENNETALDLVINTDNYLATARGRFKCFVNGTNTVNLFKRFAKREFYGAHYVPSSSGFHFNTREKMHL